MTFPGAMTVKSCALGYPCLSKAPAGRVNVDCIRKAQGFGRGWRFSTLVCKKGITLLVSKIHSSPEVSWKCIYKCFMICFPSLKFETCVSSIIILHIFMCSVYSYTHHISYIKPPPGQGLLVAPRVDIIGAQVGFR